MGADDTTEIPERIVHKIGPQGLSDSDHLFPEAIKVGGRFLRDPVQVELVIIQTHAPIRYIPPHAKHRK